MKRMFFGEFFDVLETFTDSAPVQTALAGSFQLPCTDQHSNERAAGANRGRAGQADRPGDDCSPHEHHHWHVGDERFGAWTERGQFILVLVQ